MSDEHIKVLREMRDDAEAMFDYHGNTPDEFKEYWAQFHALDAAIAALGGSAQDTARLDYIERTFSGMTNRERYLPVQMIWGKGCNGRTLREACDKYMARDATPTNDR